MNWLYRFLPSGTVDTDPASITCDRPGISPVTLANLKLVRPVRRRIDNQRRLGATVRCPKPRHLAVVVPYRNRKRHLEEFIPCMHAVLSEAGIDHTIVIAEQADDLPFNRGAMCNIGALAAWDLCDHLVWHDVDLLPQSAAYLAYSQPTKLVRTIRFDNGEEQRLFDHNFGGVVSVGRDHLKLTNGMSNHYWGWGLEDDDFLLRCLFTRLHPCRDDNGIFRGLLHEASRVSEKANYRSESAQARQRRQNRGYYSRMKRSGVDFAADGIGQIERRFHLASSPGQLHVKASLKECLNGRPPEGAS